MWRSHLRKKKQDNQEIQDKNLFDNNGPIPLLRHHIVYHYKHAIHPRNPDLRLHLRFEEALIATAPSIIHRATPLLSDW